MNSNIHELHSHENFVTYPPRDLLAPVNAARMDHKWTRRSIGQRTWLSETVYFHDYTRKQDRNQSEEHITIEQKHVMDSQKNNTYQPYVLFGKLIYNDVEVQNAIITNLIREMMYVSVYAEKSFIMH